VTHSGAILIFLLPLSPSLPSPCCTREDTGSQSYQRSLVFQCREACFQDTTALESYWVGGRGHQSTVPRGQDHLSILHVVHRSYSLLDEATRISLTIARDNYLEGDEVGVLTSYSSLDTFTAILTRVAWPHRHGWRVVQVDQGIRKEREVVNVPRGSVYHLTFNSSGCNIQAEGKTDIDHLPAVWVDAPSGKRFLPAPACFSRGDLRWNVLSCLFPTF